MLKIKQVTYKGYGHQKIFYIAKTDTLHSVKAHLHPPVAGKNEVEFKCLESGLWYLDLQFNLPGKYAFVIFENDFENELKTLILIVTIKP